MAAKKRPVLAEKTHKHSYIFLNALALRVFSSAPAREKRAVRGPRILGGESTVRRNM